MEPTEEKTLGDIYNELPIGEKKLVAGVITGIIPIEDYHKIEQMKQDGIVAFCTNCGRPFVIRGNRKKYCTDKCRKEWYNHRALGRVCGNKKCGC